MMEEGTVFPVGTGEVIGNQVLDRPTDQLVGAVVGEFLEALVDENDDTVLIHHHDAVRQGMHEHTELPIALRLDGGQEFERLHLQCLADRSGKVADACTVGAGIRALPNDVLLDTALPGTD